MRIGRKALLAVAGAVAFALTVAPVAAGALPSMPSTRFGPSAGCGCHAALQTQWAESMHAKAITDPIYLLKLEEGQAATGGAIGEYCNACHAPIAVMAGELSGTDQSRLSAVGKEGVTCDFCHQVSGTDGARPGNTSTAVTGDGTKLAQLRDPMAPHAAAYSAFHEAAEFCGNCHDVYHPTNDLLLEGTYSEWKRGPYAAEGIVCQDCHMTPGPGVTKPNPGKAAGMGPEREHIYTMTFAGGNVGLGDAVLAEERLKAAATLDLGAPEIVESGDVAVTTTITNSGAGHYLPTGLTEVRQMWLEVTATAEDGTVLLNERQDFGSVLKGADGTSPVELWDAVAFERDDRIPPRESVSGEYAFPMAAGEVKVKAALYYRSCSEEMAAKAGVDIPTTTMAEVTRVVYPSAAARDAAASDAEEQTADDTGAGRGAGPGAWTALGVLALVAAAIGVIVVGRKRRR